MGLDQKERVHTESSVNGGVDHSGQVSQNRWENAQVERLWTYHKRVCSLCQDSRV